MLERRFHLGIDYGTSTSKIVLRDYGGPGGDKAFVILDTEGFRIPSGVVFSDGKLLFGTPAIPLRPEGELRYESVKMRVAEESTGGRSRFHYGPKPPLPIAGLTARDLASLTAWWLISVGHWTAKSRLEATGNGELVLGMTLGIPMSFYDDTAIRNDFLRIAKVAWRLYRRCGPLAAPEINVSDALAMIEANEALDVESMPRDEIRDWIRSESEAAMWWAFQSPSVSEGPYAQIDVGAGTTHASLFRVYSKLFRGHRTKEGLAFFGACSVPYGMDAVDEFVSHGSSSERVQAHQLRGNEDQFITRARLESKVAAYVKENIWEAYRKSWILTNRKISNYISERQAWNHHKVFLLGGGNQVRAVSVNLPFHPNDNGHTPLQEQPLEVPNDLFISTGATSPSRLRQAVNKLLGIGSLASVRKPYPSDLPFLSVAYGLSNIGIAVPEIVTPSELPEMSIPQERLHRLGHEDIYAK